MRLRNIKGASKVLDSSPYVIKKYCDYKGFFNDLFINDNPLEIEIGTGKGNFIINKAIKNPNINYVGIEKYDSVLIRAVEKLENISLPNLLLIKMDADKIEEVFYKEVDRIYLNFSDPWPKDRHHKRRLTDEFFLKKYDNLFKGDKNIVFKTDNRKLFEYSLKSLTDYGYKINVISLDLHKDNYDNIKTEYEDKFSKLGYPIYMVDVTKK